MKKFACLLLTLLLVLFGAVSVSAADSFRVDITGESVVSSGSTAEFQVTINDLSTGIIGADIKFSYDPTFFELVSVTGKELSDSDWDIGSNFGSASFSAGTVSLTPVYDGSDFDHLSDHVVSADGAISYTLRFNVKEQTEKTESTLRVTSASVDVSLEEQLEDGTLGSLTVSLRQKLAAPTGLTWDGGVAKWDAVPNATGYSVQAYKNGAEVGDPVSVTEPSCDFTGRLTEGGQYTFTVIAISDQTGFEDSVESDQSSSFYSVVGTLSAPKIKLESDVTNGGLSYTITDKNASGTVARYLIKLFEKKSDTPAKTLEVTALAGRIPCDSEIKAGTEYAATVTAVSADTELNNNSAPSDKTGAVLAAETVKRIQIQTAPTLSYKEGDKLDLSGLSVTLTYESGNSETVTFKNFESKGLTVSMANGTVLAMSDSGKAITIYFGSSVSATTANLTVSSKTCSHEKTHVDRQDPTCGEDGYENVICDICGATVSSTTLRATGNHIFGEWTVVYQPTANMKGLRERVCDVCGEKEVEEIPATGVQTSPQPDTDPIVTNPPVTDPPVTREPSETVTEPHTMDDLSRIFLIIVIVIFALILILIIGGIWLENRRRKARNARAASRNRRPGNGSNTRR